PPAAETSLRSLHDALPICHTAEMEMGIAHVLAARGGGPVGVSFVPQLVPMSRGILATIQVPLTQSVSTADVLSAMRVYYRTEPRSEEHTSELQSRENLVCR